MESGSPSAQLGEVTVPAVRVVRPAQRKPYPWKSLIAIPLLLTTLALAIWLPIGLFQVFYRDRIYPGVEVWGIPLEGMTPEEAEAVLVAALNFPHRAPVIFTDGERRWELPPERVGLRLDADATAMAAFRIGRHGPPWDRLLEQARAWWEGEQLAPRIIYDERTARAYLEELAQQINQPVRDAALRLEQRDAVNSPPTPVETTAQVGRELNVGATLALLQTSIGRIAPIEVPLVIAETPPRVVDASEARRRVEAILSGPITLTVTSTVPLTDDLGPWVLSPQELAGLVILGEEPREDGVHITATLDTDALWAFLTPIAELVAREPENPRFVFNDQTRQLELITPGKPGQSLDLEATLNRLLAAAMDEGEREVAAVLTTVPPSISDSATAEELGIRELLVENTSYFAGSSAGRVNNITVAASRFHGILVAPGETFSFNKYLGEVSKEAGYDESLIIYGNRTVVGLGGGVCQVSTTAFRAAFWAGLPIVERWAHGYRVGYYEQGGIPPGLDATVYSPLVDLKFVNDTPGYILIETYVNPTRYRLTFKFYGTSDGRTVEMIGPEITDIIPHGEPIYEEDPTLPKGTIKQVDWAVDGLTATVKRIVRDANGQVMHVNTFVSKYHPWRAVYKVGTGGETGAESP